jgi:LacI family transcriptional regulator
MALFTAHERATLGAIQAFSALDCWQTRTLVGFDYFPLFDRLRPGISVVAHDPQGKGTIGAEVLFARISGDKSAVKQHVLPTTLIPRGSGEIPPRRDSGNGRPRQRARA